MESLIVLKPRQYVRAEDRIGQKYGKLTCLGISARRGGPYSKTNTRYVFRCDCGRVVTKWFSHIYREPVAHCGCDNECEVKRRLIAKAKPVHAVPYVGVCGVHLTLQKWGEICGVTRERIRQRVRDYGADRGILAYSQAVAWLLGEVTRRRDSGEMSEMDAQVNIAKLMEEAKKAEPDLTSRYQSKFAPYDDILRELHGKGYRASSMMKWFAERGIVFKYTAISVRLKRMGLSPGQGRGGKGKKES